jgi:hypothetical protein
MRLLTCADLSTRSKAAVGSYLLMATLIGVGATTATSSILIVGLRPAPNLSASRGGGSDAAPAE